MNYVNKLQYHKTRSINLISKVDAFFRQKKIKLILFSITVFTSFILIYILNILHPLFGDDWMYSMLPGGHKHIHSFSDILYTQYKHYFTWGGRSVVHIIAQSLLLSGIKTADFFNSLAYVALTLVIYYISNSSKEIRSSLLIGINLLIWFFQPAFGSTILWITGSANYLWGTLIILLFLVPYIKILRSKNIHNSIFKSIWIFLFGIIAGWTNENMSVALITILIICIIYYKMSFKKIPLWSILGLIGATIGAIFMIAAPGNYARMETIISTSIENHSFLTVYIYRFFTTIASFYYYALSPTFIIIFIFFIYSKYKKNTKNNNLFIAILFFAGAVIATLAMAASPIFPGRAAFGIDTFLFVVIGILFSDLNFKETLIKNLTYTVLVFGLLLFIVDYTRSYRILSEVNKHYTARLQIIEEGKAKNQVDFILDDRINPENKALHYFELTPDTSNWHNKAFSSFYDINSISVVNK